MAAQHCKVFEILGLKEGFVWVHLRKDFLDHPSTADLQLLSCRCDIFPANQGFFVADGIDMCACENKIQVLDDC